MITDYADNLQRLAQIIATMDTPAAGDVEVIPLRYAVASDIQPLLQRLTDSGGPRRRRPRAAGQNLGTAAPSILVDTRSNSLIVRSANPSKMASVRSLIAKLDLPPQGSAATRQHLGRAPEERRRDQARARCCAPRSAPAPAAASAAPAGDDDAAARQPGRHGGHRHFDRHLVRGSGADQRLRGPVHRRLHPGRPVDQFADHHRRPSRSIGRCAP